MTIQLFVDKCSHYGSKRITKYLKSPNRSWRVDETYIKIKGKWHYLYRAVDLDGQTIDFYLGKKRNYQAAKQFFKKMHGLERTKEPRTVNVDKNGAYPLAFSKLQTAGQFVRSKSSINKFIGSLFGIEAVAC